MQLGRVIGSLVPATLVEGLTGVPMLWVQPLTRAGAPAGHAIVCADSTRMAGPGELIYYESSREAALTLDPWFVPIDDAIVGIVDGVHLTDGAGPPLESAVERRPRRAGGPRSRGTP
jgi:ethanolamine utilization protein EutN